MNTCVISAARQVHDEYLRRHVKSPGPLEQPRHGLRRVIGESLIALGERLALPETHPSLDKV
jgi:hypothetical protein